MRIKLGVFVGCMLLVLNSRTEAGDDCPATNVGTLSSGATIVGSTIDSEDDFRANVCGTIDEGSDEIFAFSVGCSDTWTLDTCTVPADWDNFLHIREETGGGCPGDFVACDIGSCGVGYYESAVSAFLNAGTTYYLIIDGWGSGIAGDFTITASSAAPCIISPLAEDSLATSCTIDADCQGISSCLGGRCYVHKNRYISIQPNSSGQATRLKVTLTGSLPHPGSVSDSWWVQSPIATVPGAVPKPLVGPGECVAVLGPEGTAAEIDWDAAGCQTLHITGCPIEPTSVYDVQAVSDAGTSQPVEVPTILKPGVKHWGDIVGMFNGFNWTPPQGLTSIDDVVAAIKTFQGGQVIAPVGSVAHLSIADVDPGNINSVVNFNDVLAILITFTGAPYPFGPADADGNCP